MRTNPTPAPRSAATPLQPTSIIGGEFGALTVVSFVCFRSRRSYFLCRCKCGRTRVASSLKLKRGAVRACRDCARTPAQNEALRLSRLTDAEIAADWRCRYNAFTHKQRGAYFRLIAKRRLGGERVTNAVRAAAVVEVLRVWVERTLEHAGREVL